MEKLVDYLINVELSEEVPYYTFIVRAKDEKDAEKKAKDIVKDDYAEQAEYAKYFVEYVRDFDELTKLMTIN
jgi:ferritin-like protein